MPDAFEYGTLTVYCNTPIVGQDGNMQNKRIVVRRYRNMLRNEAQRKVNAWISLIGVTRTDYDYVFQLEPEFMQYSTANL